MCSPRGAGNNRLQIESMNANKILSICKRLQHVQGTQKAAGRAGAAARLSARRRGRACPGSAAAAPINHPRAEGAAGALDPRRAQLPALDLSRIRSRPRPRRSRCTVSRAHRRPAAATGGPQRPQEAAGRAGAAARLSARQRGRACPGSAAACPIDLPGNERAVYCAYFFNVEKIRNISQIY